MSAPTILHSERSAARTGTDGLFRAIVWAGTGVFAAIHAALIIGRYHQFGIYTFDFGIFDQGLWLLSRFEDPFITLRGLNLFADHSSYVMVLLTPIYWLWADPRVLLVLTVVAIAAAGPLLYTIGRHIGLRPGLAAAIALAFFLHPAVRWQTWDNFHPEALVLPLLLGALVWVLDGRPWWAVGLICLALLTKEDAALVVVPFGLWVAWQCRERTAGLTMAGLGVAAFTVNFLVLLPHLSPTGDVLYSGRYTEYGSTLLGIIGGVAANPGTVLGDITRPEALSYLRDMVLTAPTSLASPIVLALGAPITLANTLSTHIYQIDIRYHYTAYLLAATGIAALYGARWLQDRARGTGYAAIITVIAVAAVAGLGPGPGRGAWGGIDDATALEAALGRIGPDDVVSASSTLAVHLAHREKIYRFPNPFRELDYGTPGISYDAAAAEVEWIVLDPAQMASFAYATETLTELRAPPGGVQWEAVISSDEVLLLHRR
ncbi:MAG: DUF2079 domain-containing protein [Acidimicrobiia bacterium]|nr:DUF2079 domain-containing protein [Acidimicrobiia bacterium]